MFVRDKNNQMAYISWWPQGDRPPSALDGGHQRIYKPLNPYLYEARAIEKRTYEQDLKDERCSPDHTFEISGLDEEKIIKFQESLTLQYQNGQQASGPIKPWSAKDHNCSTVVHDALKAGGADEVTMNYWFTSLWTPNRVLEYAKNLKHMLDKKPPNS
ncbi:hypothetical protein [Pseudomonas syringae group genomosp. 3]|uniref:hypothetical protein n=1 Tax=Pseudomonas syringae group genomosp. 3 TaxID=251701 RepID=UPI0005C8AD10|nr:hypothetical protein [Pseudomonas syringae group genomosp. 3]